MMYEVKEKVPVAGQCNGDGPYIGVPIDEISSWDPAHHQQEHEKPIQKSIYSYKSIP